MATCSDSVVHNLGTNSDSSSQKTETKVEESSTSVSPKETTPRTPTTIKQKIDVLLKATGDAPIMKQRKWAVDCDKRVSWIMDFVRKYLQMSPTDSLFLYVNQAFALSPDQTIRNLYECFETDGKLVLHYCLTPAWG